MIGSFLNVVIHRVPVMMDQRAARRMRRARRRVPRRTAAVYNLVMPRSACPQCKAPITALQNIPVVSWLVLRGKCANCKTPISARYPLVELATGILSGLHRVAFRIRRRRPRGAGVHVVLIALTMIDFDTQYLPDALTYPLLWLGLIVSLWHPAWAEGASPWTARQHHRRGRRLSEPVGRVLGVQALTGKEGMGYGDFKLFAALGAWLGWQMLLPIIVLASGVGAIFGIVVMIRQRKGQDTVIAFGPFLAIAGWLALVVGHDIVERYFFLFSTVEHGAPVPSGSDRRHRLRQEHGGQSVRGAGRLHRRYRRAGARGGRAGHAAARRIAEHFGAGCWRRTAAWTAARCASAYSRIPPNDSGSGSSRIPRSASSPTRVATRPPGPMSIVAIPLLVETRGAERFDRVLVVDCEPALQLARLQARDGSTLERPRRCSRRRFRAQQRLAVADDVIRNDGDIAACATRSRNCIASSRPRRPRKQTGLLNEHG